MIRCHSFVILFPLLVLFACMVNVYATDYIRAFVERKGAVFDRTYGKYRLHRSGVITGLLNPKLKMFMDKHCLLFGAFETVFAAFLAVCADTYGLASVKVLEAFTVGSILFVGTLIELETLTYPHAPPYMLAVLGLFFAGLYGVLDGWQAFLYRIEGGLCGFGTFYLLRQIGLWIWKREGCGIGDIAMGTGMCLLWGPTVSIVFFFSWPLFALPYAILNRFTMYRRSGGLVPTCYSYIPPLIFCFLYFESVDYKSFGLVLQDPVESRLHVARYADMNGVLVRDVFEGTPAAYAGITAGDLILEVDGERIMSAHALRYREAWMKPGMRTNILVSRDGRYRTVSMSMNARPSMRSALDLLRLQSDLAADDARLSW